MKKEKFKLKFAVYLILRRDGKVLLSLRKNTGYMDGYYSLVTGHVDGGETPEEAMIREAAEEAGIALSAQNLRFSHVMHRLKDKPEDEYIDMYFYCDEWQGEPKNLEPEKCGDLNWFDEDSLPENTLQYVRKALEMSRNAVYLSSIRGGE